MKKTCIISIIILGLATVLLSSCGDSDSVYYEDWFSVKGYVTYKEDPFEGNVISFDKFVKDSNPAASGISRSDFAVCYKHSYDRKPRGSIVFRQWNPETLEYEEMPGKRYSIEITTDPESKAVPGIYYYLDNGDVCIVNNLYKYNLTLHTDKLSHADYAFDLKINGMKNYTFYMDKYKDYSNPFN